MTDLAELESQLVSAVEAAGDEADDFDDEVGDRDDSDGSDTDRAGWHV